MFINLKAKHRAIAYFKLTVLETLQNTSNGQIKNLMPYNAFYNITCFTRTDECLEDVEMRHVHQIKHLYESKEYDVEDDAEVDQVLARVPEGIRQHRDFPVESKQLQEFQSGEEDQESYDIIENFAPVANILEFHIFVTICLFEIFGEFIDAKQPIEVDNNGGDRHGTYAEVHKIPKL